MEGARFRSLGAEGVGGHSKPACMRSLAWGEKPGFTHPILAIGFSVGVL
jgi:hypothetical protein